MIKGIQILGILVSVYLILQTVLEYKKGNHGARRTIIWMGLWILIATLFAFPSLTLLALPILTMQDAMLSTVVIGLVIAYILMFQTYQHLSETERKLTKLVQNIAIHDYLEKATGNPENKQNE